MSEDLNKEALAALNTQFKYHVSLLFPQEIETLAQMMRHAFDIKNIVNVRAWLGTATFQRNFISSNANSGRMLERIIFAKAFCGFISSNHPQICRDFYYPDFPGKRGAINFGEYWHTPVLVQAATSISIDSNQLTFCYDAYPSDAYGAGDEVDMESPVFDDFREEPLT